MTTRRHASKLQAFAFSLLGTLTTAGAVDLGPQTQLAVPGDFNGDGRRRGI